MFKFEFEAGGPWKLKILIFENSEMYWALRKFKVQWLEHFVRIDVVLMVYPIRPCYVTLHSCMIIWKNWNVWIN